MIIPTEPIGSIPRPLKLVEALSKMDCDDPALKPLYEEAIRDTIERFEATGSPVISDGEQRKYHNFGTYCVDGLPNLAPDGFQLPFVSHTRRWPRLTSGPFRYKRYADSFLDFAQRYAHTPLKQAVISPSALSLMYPAGGIPGYSREEFIDDLLREHEKEVRNCLQKGAYNPTFRFNEAIKRNRERFPEDFMFQLTVQEAAPLTSQIAMSKKGRGGRRTLPYAFTEHGALQAANVLRSPRAVQMSVFVIRAFAKMRETLLGTRDLARKLAALEKQLTRRLDTHEAAIVDVLREIMTILNPPQLPEPPRRKIGFHNP